MYLYRLSGDHKALGVHEIRALQDCELEAVEGLWYSAKKFAYNDLALTKQVIRVVNSGNAKDAISIISKTKVSQDTTKSFKVQKSGTSKHSTKKLADALQTEQKVNLKNPDITYYCIFIKDLFYFGILTWENKDDFNKRKAHNRPKLHPSSLHPKLAKAMINLSLSDVIIDPFCGSGGILMEGCLQNIDMTGIDIDKKMIQRAKENLKHFNCSAKLIQDDATKYNLQNKVIVTDLPYGKNTKKIDNNLYNNFLENCKRAKRIILFMDANVNIKTTNWKTIFSYTYKVHNSMSRKLLILLPISV